VPAAVHCWVELKLLVCCLLLSSGGTGHRWTVDLGSDSYGLPHYFDKSAAAGMRYSFYRKSTRGHNTLTFNGDDDHPGWSTQDPYAVSVISLVNCSDSTLSNSDSSSNANRTAGAGRGEGAGGVAAPFSLIDLTPAYAKQGGPYPPQPPASRVMRGIAVTAGYRGFAVVDEWTAPGAANVTWSLHFVTSDTLVNITGEGRTAVMTSARPLADGSVPAITATIVTPPSGQSAVFTVETPYIPGPQHPVGALRKLTVVVDPRTTPGLQITFSLVGEVPAAAARPLQDWPAQGPFASAD